jgi:hypothetical protein
MALYGMTILLSAFLLFLVQPLIGKYILPWFGGTPAVWTACMLFFQVLLLGGYLYAHVLASRLLPRRQLLLHSLFLVASLLALPVFPADAWKSLADQSPLLTILGLLAMSIGIPYFLLASTSPLLQSWFSWARGGISPYRLYSLANLGSLLAITAYPFLIEPSVSLHRQIWIWSWSYAALALLGIFLALRLWKTIESPTQQQWPPQADTGTNEGGSPSLADRVLWLSLAACGSIALLATTNQLCLDVAVVPLLWVLPLALYLISFIICFHHERWYSRLWFGPALAAALVQTCIVLFGGVFVDLKIQIVSYSFTLFVSCMVCHGELVRIKPHPRHLTSYYLMIAGGGALGGFFVSVLAPHLFRGFWEYHAGLGLTSLLFLLVLSRDQSSALFGGRPPWAWAALGTSFLALLLALGMQIAQTLENNVAMTRNFFGVLRVLEEDKSDPGQHRLTLMHGRIEHGFQFADPEKRYWPTSYFGPDSGAGIAILFHPHRHGGGDGGSHLRIGVVGLGAGTIAAYGEQGDYIRFYEINPAVLSFSNKFFTYRRDCSAKVDVVLGDARISMEHERQIGASAQFDVLIIDAFSSDAIPVHLLTQECFRTYLYHLNSDGVLAVHISSRYFDLSSVVRGIVRPDQARDMQALLITSESSEFQGTDATRWVLLTRNADFLNSEEVRRYVQPWPADAPPAQPWSDDYSNLFHLLKP